MKWCVITIFLATQYVSITSELVPVSIVHFNDFHARFDEITANATDCSCLPTCIGGYSRLFYEISLFPSSLVFNAGDLFQGTLWYNLFKWNVTSKFFNVLRQDAMTLGNHEFDDGIDGLIPFIMESKIPILVANINSSREPEFQELFDTKKLVPSTVIEKNGLKIGVIGVITKSTSELSSSGKLEFLDELESINREAEKLQYCDTIFILSHCGLDVDKELAAKVSDKIDLIIGGHSHTLLYNGDPPNGVSHGPYPVVVQNQLSNRPVLVVQAAAYTAYLGNLTLYYDDTSKRLIKWDAVNPIYLGPTISKNRHINKQLWPWHKTVSTKGREVVAVNEVDLSVENCSFAECNIGDLLADAVVSAFIDYNDTFWTNLTAALINAGGIRTSILKGNVTYSSIAVCQPFTNTLDAMTIKGKDLYHVLNTTVCHNSHSSSANFLQMSGFKVVYNSSNKDCHRVISLKIRSSIANNVYNDVEDDVVYRVAMPSFLADGGDAYDDFRDKSLNRTVGPLDIDVFVKYFRQKSPIHQLVEDRIIIY